MELQTLFWNAPYHSIADGYIYNPESRQYTCLICGKTFDEDIIYPLDNNLYNALKMVKHHIDNDHDGMFNYMIELNKSYTSLSDNQKNVFKRMQQGLSDRDIAGELGITTSTIRNYRFKFHEKEKQAKIFLALMDSLRRTKNLSSEPSELSEALVHPHRTATSIDERYDITTDDKLKTIAKYFDETGRLLLLPSKQKKKIIVLSEIVKNFKEDTTYTEKEINRILQRITEDYVHVRRYFIEYGFFDRSNDGSQYWRK